VALSSSVEKNRALFWSFSLTVYRDSNVQKECLNLQDRFGVDVNLLLFCAFAGAIHHAVLPARDLQDAAALVDEWHKHVVRNLRATRRVLQPFATGSSSIAPAAEALRNDVKTLEREAERLEQAMLAGWSIERLGLWPREPAAKAVAANVRALLTLRAPAAGEHVLPANLIAVAVAAGAH
jgi:uncharacterized protein (TIGR02444 family)